ncbi:hypothetical protein Nepgr_002489 [Nepenthes gracilis]|uniref:Eukaryotic translation initiation factor 4G n=1 Tax=Nepenthes gracilis TaxID=150966 RepID=A0AAD3RYG6_NEPGR|nr:hypothetical protein Nepgr_002489 [Nepenthes gracilis]
MSLNQSRSDKNDSQYRKSGTSRSGSSGPQRTFTGGGGKGGGGGGTTAPPLATHSSALSSNRSYKKTNNAQGGHSWATVGSLNTLDSNAATAARAIQNGTHAQPPLHGASDAPATAAVSKQTDTSAQKSIPPIPRAPSSQSSTMTSDPTVPKTPRKAPGDAARGFPLQFGSITPGFMNGMQVPARTSSAPPNLNEQKRDQARRDSLTTVPAFPIPLPSKPQLPKKDAAPVDQTATGSTTDSKGKKDSQVSSVSPVTQSQKPSVLPAAGISMPMHFHQQLVPMQFGTPNPQVQSQSMQGASIQVPMPISLQMGNAPQVQQQVFVQSIQHHLMPPPGIMHQGQGLGYNPQMGPQLSHQLGTMGLNVPPQFTQQQTGGSGSTRKTLKITHPETHEELRLEKRVDVYTDGGSLGSRPHHSLPPQSQPLPTYTPTHPIGYYANSYGAGHPFFPPPSSLPLTNAQLNSSSQAPRFKYPVSQAQQNISLINPSAPNSLSISRGGTSAYGTGEMPNVDHPRDAHSITAPAQSTSLQVTIKPPAGSGGERVIDSTSTGKGDSPKLLKLTGSLDVGKNSEMSSENCSVQSKPGFEQSKESLPSDAPERPTPEAASFIPRSAPGEPLSVVSNVDVRREETVLRLESNKEHQKKQGKKEHSQPSHQVDGQSNSSSSPQTVNGIDGSKIGLGLFEPVEAKTKQALSGASESEAYVSPSDVSGSVDDFLERVTCDSNEIHGSGSIVDTARKDDLPLQGSLREAVGPGEPGEKDLQGWMKPDNNDLKNIPASKSLKAAEVVEKTEQGTDTGVMDTYQCDDQSTTCQVEADRRLVETSTADQVLSTVADGCNVLTSDASLNRIDSMSSSEDDMKSGMSDRETATVHANLLESNSRQEVEVIEITRPTSSSDLVSSSNSTFVDPNKARNIVPKGRRKRKEILQKADAAGITSDLYMAYKGPEEKKETAITAQNTERTSDSDVTQVPPCINCDDATTKKKIEPSKEEVDDWEDAADISTPKLESWSNEEQGGLAHSSEAGMAKKYSRDFLLTFFDQCIDLPEGFEITSDIADVFIHPNVNASRAIDRECPSPGRIVDRQSGVPRVDRHGSGMIDADRWSKLPGPFPSGRDMGPDLGYGGNMIGFRPGQGSTYGVLRNPRAQAPVQHAGGILSGPMQSLGSQGGLQRNKSDTDRWLRGANFQKGLMPPPQTPLQVMHKAEKKYEVGKVSDEEQAKQRQIKAILNKLTPQNFEKLFEQVKDINMDNAVTLSGVISQIFDKALTEPTFCEMYADFCCHLASEVTNLRRLLLNNCQEEFERGVREQEEANYADGEGEAKQTEEEREERRLKARRRMLGNIRLIGELYKKKMLPEKIMHECINRLLGQYQNPEEEDVEALCKLMSTIGEMMDQSKAKKRMDAYFDIMMTLSNNMNLSSRVRFMLKDAIDLRRNKWQQRRKVEGPKKIEEVHRDAAQERQAQASRLTRAPSMNSSMRRGQSQDFGPRGSTLPSSPVAQIGGALRGLPVQFHGYSARDARLEERSAFENRTVSMPLPQRPLGVDSITLGPQGGLARGMSIRGQPSASSVPLADTSSGHGDTRRMISGLNGYSSVSEHAAYNSREELHPRHPPERFAGPAAYDQSSCPELSSGYVNRDQRNPDRNYDCPKPTSPPFQSQGVHPVQNISSEKVWPEERLRDLSIAAIKEFYCAKNEREVVLCIKDLNAPRFHPSLISIWVTDSFERKDMERDMLAKLLVNLSKPHDGMFTPLQLIEGFESVLTNLEDTVNDAPKAAEFLGKIFAKVITEKVVSLREVGRLIRDGGEEPGRLREVGLAADVLGSILEIIKSDKGESTLNEICTTSNLQLEDFRPPDPLKSKKLELFI